MHRKHTILDTDAQHGSERVEAINGIIQVIDVIAANVIYYRSCFTKLYQTWCPYIRVDEYENQ